ncbi:MAG: hypothetical protein ABI832_08975 [bacterium]
MPEENVPDENGRKGNEREIYVLVLREIVVAQDIGMIIRDLRPDARIVVAANLAEAAESIPEGKVAAAFVEAAAHVFATSPLWPRVQADGGKSVLVNEAVAGQGHSILSFPFDNDDVAALLAANGL